MFTTIPELTLPDVEREVEALLDAEDSAVLALGRARLSGLPARDELRTLRDLRDRLDIARAVHRVAQLQEVSL